MRVPFRAPVIALALLLAGCVSVTNPAKSPTISGEEVARRPPATDVVIFVDLDGGNVKTIPDTAYVESPAQNIRWYSNAPDLRIVFKGGIIAPPNCIKGKGRCEMRLEGKDHGEPFKYEVIVNDAAGSEYRQDPRLIIDY